VFGVGNRAATIAMFVGGRRRGEDIQGIPFVGRAGQKRRRLSETIGLTRGGVYRQGRKCRPQRTAIGADG
jgi:uracil-DNA glycosylase family 4